MASGCFLESGNARGNGNKKRVLASWSENGGVSAQEPLELPSVSTSVTGSIGMSRNSVFPTFPVSIDEILRRSGLNPSVDASLLEGTLPNDSYWVLSSLVDMPSAILGAEAEQRNRIQQIANYCKFGTKDPVGLSLLEIGFKHLGRNPSVPRKLSADEMGPG